jgi:DNA-binding NtrC family response regulator
MTNEPHHGAQQDAAAPAGAGPAQPPARILLLEDSPFDAQLAQRLMTRAGLSFQIMIVETMAGFTEQLAEFRPDVIVSDFQLPGFTGDKALRVAQQQHPEIPYIFWSGALGDERAVDLIKQGATDYILKDRPARLPSAVGRALAEVRQRSRLAQIEEQLGQAQLLASMGHLRAAEQVSAQVREMLDTIRDDDGQRSGTVRDADRPGADGD